MSVNILRQLQSAFAKSAVMTAQTICKTASLTRVFINDPIAICHTYTDDVESLLYVLTWIIVLHDGPLGHEHCDVGHKKTFLALWSKKAACDLLIASNAKFTFLMDSNNETLDNIITPYCRDLVPLIHQWCQLHREALLSQTLVQISDVAKILDTFIAGMPDVEQPVEMPSTLKYLIEQHQSSDFPKCLHDEVRSMDNPPFLNKHFKPL